MITAAFLEWALVTDTARIYCSRCGAPIRPGAKFCTRCGLRVTAPQEEESSGYRSVFSSPAPAIGEPPYASPSMEEWRTLSRWASPHAFFGTPGPERHVTLYVVLSLLSCGLFTPIWMYLIGRDLRRALVHEELRPGLDLLLAAVTCGVWWFYLLYRYPSLIVKLKRRVGLSGGDLPAISLVLGILSLGLVSLALMQSELNHIWRVVEGRT